MTFYYHWAVSDELAANPTLQELTDFVQGEIGSEGNFGPYKNLRAISYKRVSYHDPDWPDARAFRVKVTGPATDIKIIRSNLIAEYGRLTPEWVKG